MPKTTFTAVLASTLITAATALPAQADLQTVYETITDLDDQQKAQLIQNSQFLGNGASKNAYRLPNDPAYDDGTVVLKICRGDTDTDCLPPELADYATIGVDFGNELVDYYPHNAGNIALYPCPDAQGEDCQFMVESYINGPFENIGGDFGGDAGVTASCQWANNQQEAAFIQALDTAMAVPYGNGNYGNYADAANAQSIGNISAVLTTTDYIFIDLQGGFTGQNGGPGFIISDTGALDDHTIGERNCQVNWLCNLAIRLGGNDVCDYIQNL